MHCILNNRTRTGNSSLHKYLKSIQGRTLTIKIMNINVDEFFTTHLPRALSSTNSLDGKYFQLDESNEGNKIII